MSPKDHFRKFTVKLLEKYFAVPPLSDKSFDTPQKILVVRQHNQFGDLLASVSLFRAIKESFPDAHLTLVASPENYFAVINNQFIDELIVFDRKKLFYPGYFIRFKKALQANYDLAIVPATVAVSMTSCLLSAFSKARIKIGPVSLNGKRNDLDYLFNYRVNLDWRKCPDAHVSDFILDIVRPFGIKTKDYSSSISFDGKDAAFVDEFIDSFFPKEFKLLIGFHMGAGKEQNRWSLDKYIDLIERINSKHKIKFYFTGSDSDSAELNYIQKHFGSRGGYFLNNTIPQVAALIARSDLFITNDTGVMHVAGTTKTPQISIFGPTNPFNWAPVGHQKYFLRKSELIDDVTVDDVENLFDIIYKNNHQ